MKWENTELDAELERRRQETEYVKLQLASRRKAQSYLKYNCHDE